MESVLTEALVLCPTTMVLFPVHLGISLNVKVLLATDVSFWAAGVGSPSKPNQNLPYGGDCILLGGPAMGSPMQRRG